MSSLASTFCASPETTRDHIFVIFIGWADATGDGGGADTFDLRTSFGLKMGGIVMMRGGKENSPPSLSNTSNGRNSRGLWALQLELKEGRWGRRGW
jgi:hypothetical protein